jgi:glycerophosphoryl diester phosphodiesterase
MPKAIDPNTIKEAKDAGFTGVNYDYRYVTPELRQAAKDAGLEFLVWTVDEFADIERMVKMDVGAITTNKPDTTRATVEKFQK